MQIITELKFKDVTIVTDTGSAPAVKYCRGQPQLRLPDNVSVVYAGAPSPEALAMLADKGIVLDLESINNFAMQPPVDDEPVIVPNTYLVYVTEVRHIVVYHVHTWMEMLADHYQMRRNCADAFAGLCRVVEGRQQTTEFFAELVAIEQFQPAMAGEVFDLEVAARVALKLFDKDCDDWYMSKCYQAYVFTRTYGTLRPIEVA